MVIAGREIVTSASIGVAMGGGELATVDDLLRAADVAMYRAKHEGKARYAVFERSMQSEAIERLELEAGLRLALERNEFVVYYQPTVGLDRNAISGFEALVRWNHPTRGVISPALFIPIAEETGLIVPLGEWVLRQACQQAREWQHAFSTETPLSMSVNLSVRQFQDANIVERISAVLRDSQLAPDSLILEITESVMMQDSESTLAKLQALKALGLRLALDDFGTGYSSLGYLQRFPLDILKIDKSFVDRLMDGQEPMALVRTIIQLGQTLQMRIVAEGIEHIEQADQLRALGCGLGQGYLFARPLPAHEVRALLDRSLQRTDTGIGRRDAPLARAA
jgi:EAL domain-containing protein (putative c-di-GMP-specific phosphodiesterase class I)